MESPFSKRFHLSPNLREWFPTIDEARQKTFREALLEIESSPLPDGKMKREILGLPGLEKCVAFRYEDIVVAYRILEDNTFEVLNTWPNR